MQKIAIVSFDVLAPGAISKEIFWKNILEGRDLFTDVPSDHWLLKDFYDPDPSVLGKTYAQRGAFLPDIDFSPLEFGIPPNLLPSIDSVQLLSLVVAKRVLNDITSVQKEKVSRQDISVILGVASATELVGHMSGSLSRPHWQHVLSQNNITEEQAQKICDEIIATYPVWNEQTFPGLLGNVVAGRIANRLDLGGTNCVIDAACASSLGAMSMAIHELQQGHSKIVITGGTDALNDIFMYMCFSKTKALSLTGDCRPFSKDADGTMLGEGIGMLALRLLEDAERDGDTIYAVISGLGSSSDGQSKSVYAPHPQGQALAIRRAHQQANYFPQNIGLIEAHGTGTVAGDIAEFEGLKLAFGESKEKQWCALGSVKSQIGHTKAAAGTMALFKTVMALHHKILPPTIKVKEPNPKLQLPNSPFYLNTQTRPWIHTPNMPRLAGVSSFGFGGSNFHVALEEYRGTQQAPLLPSFSATELILLCGESLDDLQYQKKRLQEQNSLNEIARYSQENFSPSAPLRLALLMQKPEQLENLFIEAQQRIKAGDNDFSITGKMHFSCQAKSSQIAFLFPGQGSQYLNMGAEWAMRFPLCRQVWDETEDFAWGSSSKLSKVTFPIPVFNADDLEKQKQQLRQTQWAQPAIGTTSVSLLKLLQEMNIHADFYAGHSYGEITALYAAGVIPTFADFLSISSRRGQLMAQAAKEPGAMVAVFTSLATIQALLENLPDHTLTIANINSPQQIVIAGHQEEIKRLEANLQENNLHFSRLPVATAFHSPLVSSCTQSFCDYLQEFTFQKTEKLVYCNTTGNLYPDEPKEIKNIVAQQLIKPVRFQEQIENMYKAGVTTFVEIGPSNHLKKLVEDCLPDTPIMVASFDSKKQGLDSFWDGLGKLAVSGVSIKFSYLWSQFAAKSQEQQTPTSGTVKINGTNYGKLYPKQFQQKTKVSDSFPETHQIPYTKNSDTNMDKQKRHDASINIHHPQWLQVFRELQHNVVDAQKTFQKVLSDSHSTFLQRELPESTIDVQKTFQKALSDSHITFLKTSETAFLQLGNVHSVSAGTSRTQIIENVATPSVDEDQIYTPWEQSKEENEKIVEESSQQKTEETIWESTYKEPVSNLPIISSEKKSNVDLAKILLQIVSEKTGYDEDVLGLDMDMEAELGIDSIKRVEILSALQKEIPEVAKSELADISKLNTLNELIASMQKFIESNADGKKKIE